jgi:hypothetical protein
LVMVPSPPVMANLINSTSLGFLIVMRRVHTPPFRAL